MKKFLLTLNTTLLLCAAIISTVSGEWKEFGLESENLTCIYSYDGDYLLAGTSQGLYVCSLSHLPTEDPTWVKTDIPEKLVTNICNDIFGYDMSVL